MIKRKIFIGIVACVSVLVIARNSDAGIQRVEPDRDFPYRVLQMASALNSKIDREGFPAFQKINKKSVSRDYGPAMARIFLARRDPTDDTYLGWMTDVSRFCWIKIIHGSVCGARNLPSLKAVDGDAFQGYLFVSDWIDEGRSKYFLMIISQVRPSQTLIAQVTYHGGVKALYDSFGRRVLPCRLPADASIGFISTVYRVKTLSSTRFEIYEGSYTGATRAAILQLSLGAGSCSINMVK